MPVAFAHIFALGRGCAAIASFSVKQAAGDREWELPTLSVDRLFEDASAPMYLLGRSGRIRWMNGMARHVFGSKVGDDYLAAVAPISHRAAQTAFTKKVLGTRPETHTRGFLRGKDGEEVPVLIHAISVFDTSGNVSGVFGVIELAPPDVRSADPDLMERLTPRQYEVLDLLSLGYSTERIAAEMSVARETARNHVRGALRALGVNSRVEALAAFRRLEAAEPSYGGEGHPFWAWAASDMAARTRAEQRGDP
jgi:DNA-binding CsgD family transcriptional regulator